MKKSMLPLRERSMCPENCRYRSRSAPFCGYCMLEILNRKEEAQNGEHNKETDGNASEEGHRY